jgi:GT2 family glycosyltransferase
MSLAVITVHYQHPELTQRLINSVKDCSIVQKIIVISHDSFSMPSGEKLEFLCQPNRGYAAGLNRGVEVANSSGFPTILAVNPDVVLECKTVDELVLQHQKADAACTFPVLSENGQILRGYRFGRFGSLQITDDPEWYSGACFIFNVEAWKKAGGFDEGFFHYFEDRDFCLRIRNSGGKLYQAKNVVVVHETKSGMNFVQTNLPKFAVRNHLLSLERSGLLNPISFFNVILRYFFYLFRWKTPWQGIRGWIHGIQEFLTRERV